MTVAPALRRISPDPAGRKLSAAILSCGGVEDEVEILSISTSVEFLVEVNDYTPQMPPGWWVRFSGSRERMYAGREKPDVEVGDLVTIRITKARRV